MGAEFVTFDNAIVRIIRRCELSGSTQNFHMPFSLPADYHRSADYRYIFCDKNECFVHKTE